MNYRYSVYLLQSKPRLPYEGVVCSTAIVVIAGDDNSEYKYEDGRQLYAIV